LELELKYFDIDISKIRLVSNTEGTKQVGMIGYGLK
jgi:3,4-dihydroxy 2-butanone 4-phosphate synthase/GTP cyclohydrolase II